MQMPIIGRRKADSEELGDDEKPDYAHISRAEIKERGKELKIVRHGMPYGTVGGENGLFFLAYAKDPSIFEKMLGRMMGLVGTHDRLMDFTRPVSGAFFFTPSAPLLLSLGARR